MSASFRPTCAAHMKSTSDAKSWIVGRLLNAPVGGTGDPPFGFEDALSQKRFAFEQLVDRT